MESLSSLLTDLSAAWDPRMYDLLAIFLVLITALHGAFRGLIKETATLICIAMSYVLASPLGHLCLFFLPSSSIPSFVRTPIALTIGGLLGYILTAILLAILIRTLGWRRKKWTGAMKYVMHGGGALIGGIFGFLLVMIISWYIIWIGTITNILLNDVSPQSSLPASEESAATDETEEQQETVQQEEIKTLPAQSVINHREGMQGSFIGSFAEKTMPVPETVTKQAGETMESLAELTRDPALLEKITRDPSVQELLQSAAIQRLLQDNDIRAMAAEKDIMGLMSNPTLRETLNDPDVAEKLQMIDIMKLLNPNSTSSSASSLPSSEPEPEPEL